MLRDGSGGDGTPSQVLWSVWGALAFQPVLLGAIGWLVRRSREPSAEPAGLGAMALALAVVAVALAGAIFVLGPVLSRRLDYLPFSIVRWTLAETIGLFGFVLLLIDAASWKVVAAFLVWSFVLLVMLAPTERSRESFEELRR